MPRAAILARGHLHVDGLVLLAEKDDLFHVLYGQQFPLEQFGTLSSRHRCSPHRSGRNRHRNIAEIVVDEGGSGPGRQLSLIRH